MDRIAWLTERRKAVEADYTRDGPSYDAGYDPRTRIHLAFVARLIDACPPGGVILDAPCGTGPYFAMVLAAGRRVVGADQSAGMLAAAAAKHPDVRLEAVGLQELRFEAAFDAAMCVDSMEHVPPEEWPLVVANLHRALRPRGHLYVTCEETTEAAVAAGHAEALALGLPAVRGELVGEGTGGYHYYPGREQARRWLDAGGFAVVDEADEWFPDGWGYHHLLLRRR